MQNPPKVPSLIKDLPKGTEKLMYIGKDGRDYSTIEELEAANIAFDAANLRNKTRFQAEQI